MKKQDFILLSGLLLIFSSWAARPLPAQAATYYLNPAGGTYEQCDGLSNAAYPGSGTNQHCAWQHLYEALPPRGYSNVDIKRISGGDTLIIASGAYRIGYTPGVYDDNNGPGSCKVSGTRYCDPAPIPAGPDATHPTRILGEGWDSGCATPPQLVGVERLDTILNLLNSDNVELRCLEITDQETCGYNYGGTATSSWKCNSTSYPYGDWAYSGIYAADSENVLLEDIYIHGIGGTGLHGGRLKDWTIKNSKIMFNSLAGWDGDIDSGGAHIHANASNSGYLKFSGVEISHNGVIDHHQIPGRYVTAYDQNAGGYGDGLATNQTGGDWSFDNCIIENNTSDGIDLLYHYDDQGSITIKNSYFRGNIGQQMKLRGPSIIENNLVVGNCDALKSVFPTTKAYDIYDFVGAYAPDSKLVSCRAGGAAVVLTMHQGASAVVVNNTFTGEGDSLISVFSSDPWLGNVVNCNGNESVISSNNLFYGTSSKINVGSLTSAYYWQEVCTNFKVTGSNNLYYNVKSNNGKTPCEWTTSSLCDQDPEINEFSWSVASFDFHLLQGAPAIDAGLSPGVKVGATSVPTKDIDGNTRSNGADIGAYEWTGEVTNLPAPTIKSIVKKQ